jgi:NAD(P)-dependent dehydrogenase (short-subunit alcohol dehydrogenase family)
MLPNKPTKDGYEQQMQTNHLSHFLLTSLLMPCLERAASAKGIARVVNHSSIARKRPGTPLAAKYLEKHGDFGGESASDASERYHQTKLANLAFTVGLQVCSVWALIDHTVD